MIDNAPILRIHRNFARPTAEQVAAFAGVPTGHLVDAMSGSGALDERIKPITRPSQSMVGVAVTCHAGPSDNLALFGSLDVARPGDVLVAGSDGFTAAGITGDLLVGMARNIGVAGLVTDSAIRDLAGILAVGLPVYCAGLTPNSPARNGPGTVGLPIVLGGVRVASGDIVVGDADGVVIVPRESIPQVLSALERVRAAEAALEAKVKAGLKIPDFIRAILDSDRVVEVP
jgi:4-hydroxy-4-methyl-2-oxoglutarate aldolase